MASNITGVKTGTPTTAGTPAKVVAALKEGYPRQQAQAMGPKPTSDVRV